MVEGASVAAGAWVAAVVSVSPPQAAASASAAARTAVFERIGRMRFIWQAFLLSLRPGGEAYPAARGGNSPVGRPRLRGN